MEMGKTRVVLTPVDGPRPVDGVISTSKSCSLRNTLCKTMAALDRDSSEDPGTVSGKPSGKASHPRCH